MNYAGAGLLILSPDLGSLLCVFDARSRKWGPPKGHREPYDTSDLQTAEREVHEETGLTTDDYTVIPELFKISKGSQSYLFRYAIVKDEARKTGVKPGSVAEIAEVRWIPIQQLVAADSVLDGNKYLRTWITDMKQNVSKESVHLFRSLCAHILPLQESASPANIVTCG